MRFYIDTEFSERGNAHPIIPISVGIVSEQHTRIHVVNMDVKPEDCNEWVRKNVLPCVEDAMWLEETVRAHQHEMKRHVREFIISHQEEPTFWGYYADYDWVVFCQLFGHMVDLPKGWPMYCRDIKQVADMLGDIRFPKAQFVPEHHALADALDTKYKYDMCAQAWRRRFGEMLTR